MKYLFFGFFLMVGTSSGACSFPPKTLLEHYHELVKRTTNIALAKALKKSTNRSDQIHTFEFNVTEIIRGKVPQKFSLRGYSANENSQNNGDFSLHRDPVFWAYSTGNSAMPGDCNAYGYFEIGTSYLIFYDGPSHTKSYEAIHSADDLWLNVVKLLVKQADR